MLVGMSRSKRHRVMASLANLTKYLGCYDYWRSIVKNAGLRWDKRSGVEAFLSIVNTDLREVERWLRTAIRKLPRKHSATLVFQALTGVRPSEACKAVSLMAELDGIGELEKYFNRELSMLEHFRFPKLFLRRSKNCYISFVSEDVLRLVLKAVREKVTYAAMVQVIQSRGLPIRMLQLRKLYATTLRERGVTKEIIDLLQGRIGQSIFLRHYYKPYLSQVKTKVLEAMEKLANELTITLN
jgi:intergrase/recombinase